MLSQRNAANRTVVVLLVAAALYAAGHALSHTVSCFLLSFVIAYLLDPFVMWLEGRKVPRALGIVILYVLLAVLSVIFLSYLVPYAIGRGQALIPSIPVYLEKAKQLGLELQGRAQPLYGAEWRWAADKVVQWLDGVLKSVGDGVYSAAASMVFNLFNLVLAPILVFFMLFYKKDIKEEMASWLPERQRGVLLSLGREINDSIGGFLKGQIIVSAIVAILVSATLYFLEVDYAIFNGIFAGFASVLPFIGVVLATLPPLFFAYLKFQSGIVLVKVLAAFAGIYFLEGYLVKPLVFRSSMDLNPLLTIIMVMALGELIGFWGILLAIPVAAAARIIAVHAERGDFRQETPL